jgi:AcrR family transcriptional regulator
MFSVTVRGGTLSVMAASQPGTLRRTRERELIAATRRLFDERGALDAPVEEIAREVGIARGLIYRQFSSKEELYVLTVTDYLDELGGLLDRVAAAEPDPMARLERGLEAYAGFCSRYPAFIDASLSLMRRPALDLHDVVSESVWLRLGQGMSRCVGHLTAALREGTSVEDPDLMANLLWTQVLGAMHLARSRVGIRERGPGVPELFRVEPGDVVAACVRSALASVRES